jgi:hypothetical protein
MILAREANVLLITHTYEQSESKYDAELFNFDLKFLVAR